MSLQTLSPRPKLQTRPMVHRTGGQSHGGITRLFSPGDLGEHLKPFVFLDRIELRATASALFGYHPHSGIATITTVFEGDTIYEDTTGASGVLKAGGVEWMKAGGGVWHTANPHAPGRVRGYQLWLALPTALELTPPESHYLAPELVPEAGNVRVILGAYGGQQSPLPNLSALTYLHVRLRAGDTWTFAPPPRHDVAWVAAGDGALHIDAQRLSRELAVFADGDSAITVEAESDVEFMLGSAVRHPHPLVTGHYSVHTSREALQAGEAGIRAIGGQLKAAGMI